jgi:hypothetical protein
MSVQLFNYIHRCVDKDVFNAVGRLKASSLQLRSALSKPSYRENDNFDVILTRPVRVKSPL